MGTRSRKRWLDSDNRKSIPQWNGAVKPPKKRTLSFRMRGAGRYVFLRFELFERKRDILSYQREIVSVQADYLGTNTFGAQSNQ
jgi:hypothetical protein